MTRTATPADTLPLGLTTAAGMVGAGLGVTALKRSILPLIAFARIRAVSLHSPSIARHIAIVHRARPTLSPLAEALLAIVLTRAPDPIDGDRTPE